MFNNNYQVLDIDITVDRKKLPVHVKGSIAPLAIWETLEKV